MKIPRLLALLLLSGPAVGAQTPGVDSVPRAAWKHAVTHYGKWVATASAVTLTALAIQQHQHSNTAWNALLAICNANSQNCSVGPDGRYRNYQSEYDYQLALYYDHRARWRLVAGQVSLLAAVGLFVADLHGQSSTPPNIPVKPVRLALTPTPGGAALSVHVSF